MNDIVAKAWEQAKAKTCEGKLATYIPELGKGDPDMLGICVHKTDGTRISIGDTDVRFTVQSISKLFTLAIALEEFGFDNVFSKVGMEPSGEAFNSFIRLEREESLPANPMVNTGAICLSSLLVSKITFDEMLEKVRLLCQDDDIVLNKNVYMSEMNNISRNRAIAYLLDSKGFIQSDVERSLHLYVKICSLNVTAESLASFGLILANRGVDIKSGKRILEEETVRIVKTIMMTCGMYDGSGEFAMRVGLPSKSGVGGGIMSVASDNMGIGIFAPALDPKGNSVAGQYLLELLSKELKLNMFL